MAHEGRNDCTRRSVHQIVLRIQTRSQPQQSRKRFGTPANDRTDANVGRMMNARATSCSKSAGPSNTRACDGPHENLPRLK
eukprot:5108651-Alexandrium_andersonii.AAC.1